MKSRAGKNPWERFHYASFFLRYSEQQFNQPEQLQICRVFGFKVAQNNTAVVLFEFGTELGVQSLALHYAARSAPRQAGPPEQD